MTGSLSVLNVGAGDIEIKYDPDNEQEVERAIKMLQDMQRRGYAILVKNDDGTYSRAVSIDAARGLYIIGDQAVEEIAPVDPALRSDAPAKKRRGRPPGRRREVPIRSSHAVGIARSAGG